jgi:hypothetical protein
MIGRKLAVVRNGEIIIEQEYSHPFVPDLKKIKDATIISVKKYGHLSLVTIVRFHFRSTNFLKNKYEEVKVTIKNITTKKDSNGNAVPKAEVSKFLKLISDYKHKIREIRHKIREEENNS